ncbi:hypothetical protein D3C80_1917280 [compost metagenome]
MVRLLTLRAFALLLPILKCGAHVRSDKTGRNRYYGITDQNEHRRHNSPKRRMRCNITIPYRRHRDDRPINGCIQRGESIFGSFYQIHQRAKYNHHNGNKRIEQN